MYRWKIIPHLSNLFYEWGMYILSIDPGRNNLGVCVLNVDTHEASGANDTIVLWTVRHVDTDPLRLRENLDSILHGVEYDKVVIERQPPRNTMTKRIEHMLEMYFAMIGKPVSLLDARAKFVFAQNATPRTYGHRKKLSIELASRFLEDTKSRHDTFCTLFADAAKKDDYADCLIQAQAFLRVDAIPRRFPRPRAPKPTVRRFAPSHVAYLLRECSSAADIERELENPKLKRAFTRFFGSAGAFLALRESSVKKSLPTVDDAPLQNDDRADQ